MYEDLIRRLREKESRYNRSLFDEAADAIEKLMTDRKKEGGNKNGKI